MILFSAENIGLTYPGSADPIFNGLFLTIYKGESLRLTGPSGAGKTSLMRLIAGLEQPTAGRVITRPRQTGMAFAEPRLLPHLSVLENLLLVTPNAHREAMEMLAALDMGALHNAKADSLSKGQAQRVALIRALLVRPELLLLDEALGGLDRLSWQATRNLIQTQRDQDGFTVIEITHDPTRLIGPAPRVFSLT